MPNTRENLEVIAHLGDHITYKEGIGICYDSALAEVIEDAYMTLKNCVTVQKCGHWVFDFNLDGSNFYRCSVCDRQETLLEKEDIYEYCPFCHCGTKMMPQPPKGE